MRGTGPRTSFRRLLCQLAIFSLCVLLAVTDCAGSMLLQPQRITLTATDTSSQTKSNPFRPCSPG